MGDLLGRMPAPALAALAALAGCGGGGGEPSASTPAGAAATAPPARRAPASPLCGELRAQISGRIRAPAATELSGLVRSRSQPRVLWALNDSGGPASILAVTSSGRALADIAVTDAENADWEDIAIGPGPDGGDALYIADIGDNEARRPSVAVYRVAEPSLAERAPEQTEPAARLTLRYPERARDAEALLVDPTSGALVLVTKSFGGEALVYVARRPVAGTTTQLRRRGRLTLGPGQAVTAGDVSADGSTIVLRTYDRAFVWRRKVTESVAGALHRRPCSARDDALLAEGQGEALALTADGKSFYTVPEGRRPLIRRHEPDG